MLKTKTYGRHVDAEYCPSFEASRVWLIAKNDYHFYYCDDPRDYNKPIRNWKSFRKTQYRRIADA